MKGFNKPPRIDKNNNDIMITAKFNNLKKFNFSKIQKHFNQASNIPDIYTCYEELQVAPGELLFLLPKLENEPKLCQILKPSTYDMKFQEKWKVPTLELYDFKAPGLEQGLMRNFEAGARLQKSVEE